MGMTLGIPPSIFGASTSKKRRTLNLGEKRLILRAQHGKCARCHKPLSMAVAHFDHRRALSRGGSNRISNYQAIHANCHMLKTKGDMKRTRRKRATPPLLDFDIGLGR